MRLHLGPLCRRHHRTKQEGWTKTRQTGSAVRWTSPTGRSWLSPSQHQPPEAPIRPLPPLPKPDPLDELSPTRADTAQWKHHGRPDDPAAYELRAVDRDPDTHPAGDDLRDRILDRATRRTLDLDDPYAWAGQPAPARPRV